MKFSTLSLALMMCAGMAAWAQAAPPSGAAEADTDAQAVESHVSEPEDAHGQTGRAMSPVPRASLSPTPASDSGSVPQSKAKAIKHAFEARFPGLEVTGVRLTPLPGLFEVQTGMNLLYTDEAVDYVLQGSLIDAKAKRDLTADRLEALQRVAFDSLPLDHAIRQVKGDGSRKMAVFEDPNCPYCKQLHQTLEEVDNITVYTFLFPILAPDSSDKARDIWCAADPAKAWNDWMLDGKVPAKAQCDAPLQENLALGRELNVRGTPALFFANGSRVNGALPLASLKEKLAEQDAPPKAPEEEAGAQ